MADKVLVEHPAGNPPVFVNADYFRNELAREDREGGAWVEVTAETLKKRKREELLDLAARLGVNVPPDGKVADLASAIAGKTDTTAGAAGTQEG